MWREGEEWREEGRETNGGKRGGSIALEVEEREMRGRRRRERGSEREGEEVREGETVCERVREREREGERVREGERERGK